MYYELVLNLTLEYFESIFGAFVPCALIICESRKLWTKKKRTEREKKRQKLKCSLIGRGSNSSIMRVRPFKKMTFFSGLVSVVPPHVNDFAKFIESIFIF